MRIFFPSAAELLTDHRGHGEGLIAWRLLSALAARGHEIVACAAEVDVRGDPPFEIRRLGAGSRFESASPLAYAAKAARELRRLGGAARFDVCHWLFPQYALDVFPRRLPFFTGPLVIPWPDRPRHPLPGRLAGQALAPLSRSLTRRGLARAHAVLLAVPAAGAAAPVALGDRTRVVPFGIDPARYAVAPLPARPVVTFLGRIARHKGVYDLVGAVALARRREPRLVLRIAGAGEDDALLRHCRAAGLRPGDGVELLGPVPHEQVGALLAASSVLCLPSYSEPFGMVLLEAMACGRALIASAVGGPLAIVSDPAGGRLVRPGDVDALAHAILDVTADRARLQAMGAFNRAQAERRFSWDRVLDAVEDAYRAPG